MFTSSLAMSALPPKADIDQHSRDVRFGSKADINGRPLVRFRPDSAIHDCGLERHRALVTQK